MKKKKDEYKFLKEATPEKFQEMFVEWYLPALRAEAYKLEELKKRVEELSVKLSNVKSNESCTYR